jgi:hypothetical protein
VQLSSEQPSTGSGSTQIPPHLFIPSGQSSDGGAEDDGMGMDVAGGGVTVTAGGMLGGIGGSASGGAEASIVDPPTASGGAVTSNASPVAQAGRQIATHSAEACPRTQANTRVSLARRGA